MKKLAERHPEKLLDLLSERLTFERTAVKLYDIVLAKAKEVDLPPIAGVISLPSRLKEIRNQEKEHEEWLEEQIRALGGNAHEMTEMSDVVLRESRGLSDVIQDDNELRHLFHALLTAELVDDTGWKVLLELADEADDDEARRELRRRSEQEDDHLLLVRSIGIAFARSEVLGLGGPEAVTP